MKKAAQVVLINEEGLILAVSRKTDHNDFGLVGGKVDQGETPEQAAIREVKEETGLDIYDLQLVFAMHKDGYLGYTYLAKYSGEINHNEPHVVMWAPFELIMKGSFGKFNKIVSESLDDMGIQYQKLIDRKPMIAELKAFVESTIRKGYEKPFEFDNIVPSSLGGEYYYVIFKENMEEEFGDNDDEYENALGAIGKKYHFKVKLPYYYYMK